MVDTWQAALDYLYGFVNWETRRLSEAAPRGDQGFQLERVTAVLDALGNPHTSWPAVHIGGTNGKGSTCSYVAEALRIAGYRVGLYTSPHLHTVRERIRVGGQLIDESEVMEWIRRNDRVLRGFPDLTTFEVLTCLAFDHFAAEKVDIAVVEVGLGGRLDTTRVVEPLVTVLTSIGLDHTEILGSTLAEIAADKAGILRAGVPVVSAPQATEATAVIASEAARLGSRLIVVGEEIVISAGRRDEGIAVFEGPAVPGVRLGARLPLAGHHQLVNAACAVGALGCVASSGFQVSADAIIAGIERADWPGRLEALPGNPGMIVDGAHNPHAMAGLRRALDAMPGKHPLGLILGVGRGKDLDGMLETLFEPDHRGRRLPILHVLATAADHPKALPPHELSERIAAHGLEVTAVATPLDAVRIALDLAMAEEHGVRLVAAGSIFLAADVREAWAELGRMPMPQRDPPTARASSHV